MASQTIPGKHRETIQRLFAALSAGNLDAALALYTEDRPTYSFPRGNGIQTCCGKTAIRTYYRRLRARYSSALVFVPRTIIIEDNVGVIEWEHSATTRGGQPYTNCGAHVIEFADDGLIQHVRSYLDTLPMARLLRAERTEP